MSIEERQRPLEFTYVPDNIDKGRKYDITYNPDNVAFPLRISYGASGIDYPLELFAEVVDFLISKGIIQSESMTKKTSFSQGIPLPQIQKKEENENVSQMSANIDPLASFDITLPAVEVNPQSVSPVAKIVESGKSGIVVDSSTSDINKEEIVRPVIHSRIKDGDPLSAEKEAAELRTMKLEESGTKIKKVRRAGSD